MQIEPKKLFPPQQEVLKKGLLTGNRSCILHMATGSGKTFLSEFAIDHVLSEGYKVVYVTPLRALAEQQATRWKNRFPQKEIGVFTGETIGTSSNRSRYSKSQILIMTPERLDAVFRHWRSHWDWIPDVNLVIIDEAHILGMSARGPRLEGALTRLTRLNPFVRILGLSATIPNACEIAAWLGGTAYTSFWRHIPLEKKIVRFSSAKDKPTLLLAAVKRCIDAGGQSLVFCNSRSRVQQIADYLLASGLPADAHHAGLVREKRNATEERYKTGEIKVLVATSTLEMGLNLPARQVVIYDSFSFNGTKFEDLPVWSFMQRAGRAGRPGLDTTGEVVLLLSKWSIGSEKYLEGECEPVESQLTDPKALAEQILIDVFSGLSRTRGELISGFLPMTLFKRQHPNADLTPTINRLCLAGLLEEREEDLRQAATDKSPVLCRSSIPLPDKSHVARRSSLQTVSRLRVNELGRLAVKMMLAPETIQLVKDAVTHFQGLKYFDVLLLAVLSPDCSPVLQANYEELDALYSRIQHRPSVFLDTILQQLRQKIPGAPTTLRFLAAIKTATICMCVTDGEDQSALAETFDIYEADIRMVSESVIRILQGVAAIDNAVKRKDKGQSQDSDDLPEPEIEVGSVADLAGQLQTMIKYGVSAEMIPLTRLSGVGGKTARKLVDAGYESLNDVAGADPEELVGQKICGQRLAAKMVDEAYSLIQAFDDTLEYHEEASAPHHPTCRSSCVANPLPAPSPVARRKSTPPPPPSAPDPYRFRRALELKVKSGDAPTYLVTGGREAHKVLCRTGVFTCDCEDFKKRQQHCKHIYAVRLARGDKDLLKLKDKIIKTPSKTIREVLPSLWFDMTGKDSDR